MLYGSVQSGQNCLCRMYVAKKMCIITLSVSEMCYFRVQPNITNKFVTYSWLSEYIVYLIKCVL